MKIGSFWGVALACFNLVAATPVVTSVTAQQRYPWNGNVDIVVAFSGVSNDVARAECAFVATNSATKAAVPVAHVTPVGEVAGSGTTWTRRFVWDATADVGEVKIADVVLSVEAEPLGGVQLWENGPYWAKCNVGASKPEEYGYYFWWGDTVGYTRSGGTWTDDWYYSGVTWVSSAGTRRSSSPFTESCPTCNKGNSTLQSQGYIDSKGNFAKGNLVAKYDAATAHLGAPWRMPTSAEIDALISNCTTTWTTRNGVYGQLVTGKGAYASKSIFLPAAGCGGDSNLHGLGEGGYYWSSTANSDDYDAAWGIFFGGSNLYLLNLYRHGGVSVRPLRGFAK